MLENRLSIVKYRFKLEAINKITLPAYKGSTLHGGFGHALLKISPIWYRYFFEPGLDNKGDWPKPFVILPPLDGRESYPKGHQFYFDLTLFGEAIQHYAIAQAAVEYLGMQMGLGYEKGQYKIIDIAQSQPKPEIIDSKNYAQITLNLPTRLRLQNNNQLYKQTPDFQLIVSRLSGRLKTLEKAYMKSETDQYHAELIGKAKAIKTRSSHLTWDDWERFSGSQKKWMTFGGLTGKVKYSGDLQPFMALLQIGEWLHIGGKTSFGLGKYELTVDGAS